MNPSTRLARMTVAALRVAGVRHVVLCPGSRSAPLAYALGAAGDPISLHVRHDERVAGFTALGAGGAVVTTSGTAAANLHPAVLEAHHGRRPLVVITADRPRALRGTWANQTSELQATLFGGAVRARLDLADADLDAGTGESAFAEILRTLAAARRPQPGPVHLDLGFSDPLLPDETGDDPFLVRPDPGAEALPPPGSVERDGRRTIVVAGDGAGPDAGLVARAAGWPLLAEPSSGVAGPGAVAAYRLLLELQELGGDVERVVVYGRPTLSRPVIRLLSRPDVELVLVSRDPAWPDPGRPARRVPRLDPASLAAPVDDGWARRWSQASSAARRALDAALDETSARAPSGPAVARAVAVALRSGEVLVVAASNPIRDLDLVGHALPGGVRVLSNRGLSGIDGTISTASGVALDGGPVRVLVGDLAFLHDLNALLVPPDEERPRLQVVVLNDDGGGVFGLLEHGERAARGAAEAAAFERLFGTPHGADLAALCAGYGVPHRRVDTVEALNEALADPPLRVSVVEVRADRRGLRELHDGLRSAVHARVRSALSPPVRIS